MSNIQQSKILSYLSSNNSTCQNGGSSASCSKSLFSEIESQSAKKRKLLKNSNDDSDLKSICLGIKDAVKDIQSSLNSMIQKVAFLDDKICSLEDRLNAQEQRFLNCEIEISGLEIKKENHYDSHSLLVDTLSKFNIKIERHEVIDSYIKWKSINDVNTAFLIVTFSHEKIKKRVISSKIRFQRTHKEVMSQSKTYFNERLTGFNRMLISEAKKYQKSNKILKVWSNNGRIYVLKNIKSEPVVIYNVQQLTSLL